MHDHHHDHDAGHHDAVRAPAARPALGSALLAMSASRRLVAAAGVIVLLWVAVGWALSYEPAAPAQAAAGTRGP